MPPTKLAHLVYQTNRMAEMRDRERRQEILDQAFPKGARSAAMKTLVNVPLYDYQAEGALFKNRADEAVQKRIQEVVRAVFDKFPKKPK